MRALPGEIMKSTFAIQYAPGPAWFAGKPIAEQPLKEHLAYLKGLYQAGHLVMGGPFTDNSGGLVVLEADQETDAQTMAANDPAVINGILTAKVRPWRLLMQRQ
jgi:uncharacterized protein YciI